jgi:preprotein translocase subunit SecG
MFQFILAFIIIDAIILAVVVLLQAGQGGGLASLGGAGGTDSLLGGRHTVTWLTKTTWVTGALFLFLSLLLTLMTSNRAVGSSEVQDLLRTAPTPVESPVPAGDQGQGQVPIPGLGETGTGSQPPANEPADDQ